MYRYTHLYVSDNERIIRRCRGKFIARVYSLLVAFFFFCCSSAISTLIIHLLLSSSSSLPWSLLLLLCSFAFKINERTAQTVLNLEGSLAFKKVTTKKSNNTNNKYFLYTYTTKWMVLIGNVCLCNKRNGKHTSTVHGYLQDKQTDEKKFSVFWKKEKTCAHTHTQRFHCTNNERSSSIGATAKERRDNNNKSTRTHTPNRTEPNRAKQGRAHKSLNNWYEAKIVFESTLHVTYYSLKRDIHYTHIKHTRSKASTYRFSTDLKGTHALLAVCLCFFFWFNLVWIRCRALAENITDSTYSVVEAVCVSKYLCVAFSF